MYATAVAAFSTRYLTGSSLDLLYISFALAFLCPMTLQDERARSIKPLSLASEAALASTRRGPRPPYCTLRLLRGSTVTPHRT